MCAKRKEKIVGTPSANGGGNHGEVAGMAWVGQGGGARSWGFYEHGHVVI